MTAPQWTESGKPIPHPNGMENDMQRDEHTDRQRDASAGWVEINPRLHRFKIGPLHVTWSLTRLPDPDSPSYAFTVMTVLALDRPDRDAA